MGKNLLADCNERLCRTGNTPPGQAKNKYSLMVKNKTILINLSIPADQYMTYYQGAANSVVARALDGRRIKFPAAILRPYVTREGVHGFFALKITPAGKLISIHRVKETGTR